ncbi:hypothetical protein [Grimontia marina]|uniref:hypothetical protein n=1 Tax=Grimontia marina TaxID=646534 RepID=UPI0012F76273|nr:hypothetical protein [Grimontia marina]
MAHGYEHPDFTQKNNTANRSLMYLCDSGKTHIRHANGELFNDIADGMIQKAAQSGHFKTGSEMPDQYLMGHEDDFSLTIQPELSGLADFTQSCDFALVSHTVPYNPYRTGSELEKAIPMSLILNSPEFSGYEDVLVLACRSKMDDSSRGYNNKGGELYDVNGGLYAPAGGKHTMPKDWIEKIPV